MTEKENKVFKYQRKFEGAVSSLKEKVRKELSVELMSALLGHHFERDDVHTFLIFGEGLENLDLFAILEKEYRSIVGQVQFDSSDFDFLIEDRIEKAKIRENGCQWIIHKNDADPYPSNPHAHEFKLNVKLHLGTGAMYRNKKVVGYLGKKEFERLRKKIAGRGIILPDKF